MTEQEIIQYLKENRNKGIAFAFVPEDVKNWCEKHKTERIFDCFQNGNWDTETCIALCLNSVYALSDDYEPEKPFRPHWEEFEIDECGRFIFGDDSYLWHQWSNFLDDNFAYFDNFGGYVYKELPQKSWQTYPVISYNEKEPPLFPSKIRFWRYQE